MISANTHNLNTAIRCFVAILAASIANTAFAGPPFQTDDPEPADVHKHELYIALEHSRTHDDISGSRPLVELNYGPIENLQIGIGVPIAFDKPSDGRSACGIGDIELSAKYRFIQETDTLPMASFFPMIALPTGDSDKALGNGKLQLFLPLWLQKNFGDWQTNFGGGYFINHASDAKNHWFVGWQIQKQLSDRWMLGGEIFHSTEETIDEGSSSGFNLGGSFAFDEHNHLLFSAGRGLSNAQATNQLSSYIGYQLTW